MCEVNQEKLCTYCIIQGATDVSPINGGHKGQILPVLSLQVLEVLVPRGAVPAMSTGRSGLLPRAAQQC